MKAYVVGGSNNYVNFIENVELTDKLEDAKLVVFTGGEDVTPSLYGCKKHESTCCNPIRDEYERDIFNKINPNTQVCYGCCRGSQFLTVMNGGKLVQDVINHAIYGTHGIICEDRKIYEITSTHHQMMYPYNLNDSDYDILFKSFNAISHVYEGDGIDVDKIKYNDPEIILYHKENLPKCLAVQGHPEMIPDSLVSKMINKLIYKLIDNVR